MPTNDSTPAKRAKRAATVIDIPKEKNRIYGNDVPILWKEAARETGIPERSFFGLIQRREIAVQMVGRRIMIRPSAIREYMDKQKVSAI